MKILGYIVVALTSVVAGIAVENKYNVVDKATSQCNRFKAKAEEAKEETKESK